MKHFTARDMVRDLIDTGLTQCQVADRAGVSQATIARVHSRASDTRYETGKRIAELHRQLCPEKYRTSKPTPPANEATTA